METHRITDTEFIQSHRIDVNVTNLGPRFKMCLAHSTTELTIQQHPITKEPRIVWINTYGNVYLNRGHYVFTSAAARLATDLLNEIRETQ